MRQHMKLRILFALLAALITAVLVAGCGGGDHSTAHESPTHGKGNAVDRAFIRLMVPHHQSAIEMARIAGKKGQHKEIKALALDITTSQRAEIDQMTGIGAEIGTKVEHSGSGMDHGGGHMAGDAADFKTLGVTPESAGMSMDMAMLENAKPFDRAFIDMMVPHHQGAVRMAKAELAKGMHQGLQSVARKIILAQEREIKEMNSWRTKWYGGPVKPTG